MGCPAKRVVHRYDVLVSAVTISDPKDWKKNWMGGPTDPKAEKECATSYPKVVQEDEQGQAYPKRVDIDTVSTQCSESQPQLSAASGGVRGRQYAKSQQTSRASRYARRRARRFTDQEIILDELAAKYDDISDLICFMTLTSLWHSVHEERVLAKSIRQCIKLGWLAASRPRSRECHCVI